MADPVDGICLCGEPLPAGVAECDLCRPDVRHPDALLSGEREPWMVLSGPRCSCHGLTTCSSLLAR